MKHPLVRSTSIIALSVMLNGLISLQTSAADLDKLVEDCVDCHGTDGVSTIPEVPSIGGFSFQYFLDSMVAYIDEDRLCPEFEYPEGPDKGDKTTMCKIAEDLSEDDTEELAEYYAEKPFVRAKQKFDPVLAEKGKPVHDDLCEKCHVDGGSLASDDAGILAGQWMPYLEVTFRDYSTGDRKQPKKMKKKMEKLDDTTTEQLIHYYGSLN